MSARAWLNTALLWLWTSLVLAAAPLEIDQVPAPLAPWTAWVLDGVPEHACPLQFDSGARRCAWSTPLRLALDATGGEFGFEAVLHAQAWVALPGGTGQWPLDVLADEQPAVVVARDGRPTLFLAAGRHALRGRFDWSRLPESLAVPADTGVVLLVTDAAGAPRPTTALEGRLWLAAAPRADAQGEHLDVAVFRRVEDQLPALVTTVLALDVAGPEREWHVARALPDGLVPVSLDSPLPARLEDDGSLRVRLRPGQWRLTLTARAVAPLAELGPPPAASDWPQEEVWSFAARTELRVVEVAGGQPVDPRQTALPEDWHALPAWRLAAGQRLTFAEQRRGDPQPEPDQLGLERQLWLDFDGGGYTVQDHLTGRVTRTWRLTSHPALELGRVQLNGEPQFITSVDGGARGVEVRHGELDLLADARLARGALPAVGWALDVKSLRAQLHLPPGWRLWAARGVDEVPGTWLQRWTLLDLFLVLIATLAAARMHGFALGALTLVTLALVWHESGAPRQVWLHLLAAQALLGVLPEHLFKRVVRGYRNLALAALVLTSLAFMIDQVRTGLYPQFERPWQVVARQDAVPQPASVATAAPPAPSLEAAPAMADGAFDKLAGGSVARSARPYDYASDAAPYARDARVQTGPGLPAWDWSTVTLTWNGPVLADQEVELLLLSPRVNLLLAALRVLLLAALGASFLRLAFGPWRRPRPPQAALLLVTVVALGGGAPARADLPSRELLDELAARLTRAPECLPGCATLPRLAVDVQAQQVTLTGELHAAAAVAVPLPGGADQWTPSEVRVDGDAGRGLSRDAAGVLWLEVPPGRHRVELQGPAPIGASFTLALPLRPERLRLALDGWSVSGLRPDGGVEAQLIFTRRAAAAAGADAGLEPRSLPAFFQVERVLRFAHEWRVETTVTRQTPADSAAALAIPLLPGEAVTSADVQVVDGKVQVVLAASDTRFAWSSVLAERSPLTLVAPPSREWVETWRADIAPLWHAELGGLAVVHHQADGRWLPTWQPWPGEQVSLALSRPAGVEGRTLTIESSTFDYAPAQRARDATLNFTLTSSQGGQHVVELPRGAAVEGVAIDDVPQPLRADGERLVLPVHPGTATYRVTWRESEPMAGLLRLPRWSLGADSVNATLSLRMPADRWVLLAGGPALGPAVLFWGVLLVWSLVAVGLGRTRFTPLGSGQWLLLAVGLTQVALGYALLVVAWLFALALRGRQAPLAERWRFNAGQVALALLTLAALLSLFAAIERGLLGQPDMQIAGNGSSAALLQWFADRVGGAHPEPWVLSVSLWFYRGLMLAWALWLAFALLGWLRWGWGCFSAGGLWRPAPPRPAESAEPPAADG
ncbi:MAG: hypothetical protein K2Y51_25270 [Gammaproteobacteria bacterium]|nr:hypothetical protein [Gammaproteobacteria bacterium]